MGRRSRSTRIVSVELGIGGSRTIVVDSDHTQPSTWEAQVHEPLMSVFTAINRHCIESPGSPLQVIFRFNENVDLGLATALLQGVRGAVGTAALELGPLGGRANTVISGERTHLNDVNAVVSYLSDGSRGGYTTGATVDLRRSTDREPSDQGTVLVTGAAGGLGFAAASAIALTGRRIVLTDRGGEALRRAGEVLGVPALPCELTETDDIEKLRAAPELADVDALIVEHGVGASSRFGSAHDFADTERSLIVNAWSVHNIVEQFIPNLQNRAGTAVVLSSQAGLYAEEGNSGYCAAKFAINGYVSSLVSRLEGSGARVHALCPGPVDTPLMRRTLTGQAEGLGLDPETFINERLKAIPLGRAGLPDQIGHSTALLLGLRSTGVILAPTGGEVLS